jgi:hypothetical protein
MLHSRSNALHTPNSEALSAGTRDMGGFVYYLLNKLVILQSICLLEGYVAVRSAIPTHIQSQPQLPVAAEGQASVKLSIEYSAA